MPIGSENRRLIQKFMHILIWAVKKMEKPLNPRCLVRVNDDVIKTGYRKNRAFQGKIMNII